METYFYKNSQIEELVDLLIEKLFTICLLIGSEADAEFHRGKQAVEKIANIFQEMANLPEDTLREAIYQLIEQRLPDPRVIANFPQFYDLMDFIIRSGIPDSQQGKSTPISASPFQPAVISSTFASGTPSSKVVLSRSYGLGNPSQVVYVSEPERSNSVQPLTPSQDKSKSPENIRIANTRDTDFGVTASDVADSGVVDSDISDTPVVDSCVADSRVPDYTSDPNGPGSNVCDSIDERLNSGLMAEEGKEALSTFASISLRTKPCLYAEPEPKLKAELKAEPKTETKPELKAETKPEIGTEAGPELKTKLKAEPHLESKTESRSERKSEAKPEPAEIKTKPEEIFKPKLEPKPEPKFILKPIPKDGAQQEPERFFQSLNSKKSGSLAPKTPTTNSAPNKIVRTVQVPVAGERLALVLKQIYPETEIRWNLKMGKYLVFAQVADLLIFVPQEKDPSLTATFKKEFKKQGWHVFVCDKEDLYYPRRLERGIRQALRETPSHHSSPSMV